MITENTRVYHPEEVDEVIDLAFKGVKFVGNYHKQYFANCPCSFDIETSSFYEGEGKKREKRAIMYGWTLGLNGLVILGRTWTEFVTCLEHLAEKLELGTDRRVICYVHNLAYEFAWIQFWLNWEEVFALDDRKPVKALCDLGIEFRCSYILTNLKLETIGDECLYKYKVQKKVGDLDYRLLRHSQTPLTDAEIGYMVNDVRVVMSYIQEQIEKEGKITKIPLTYTGYVRRYCRKSCLEGEFKFYQYRRLMSRMRMTPDEYLQLKRAFAGGFTHGNAWKSMTTLENVASFDFSSSYPAVMLSEKFPISSAEVVDIRTVEDLKENLEHYCCIFDVELHNLESIKLFEHPLSLSKCWDVVKPQVENGRIVCAESLKTTLTGEDFWIIGQFYDFDPFDSGSKIGTFRRYKCGYLPHDFVRAILPLYTQKTALKGVPEKREQYDNAKRWINACYGMCVTDVARDEHIFRGRWLEDDEIRDEWMKDHKERWSPESIQQWEEDHHLPWSYEMVRLEEKLEKENSSMQRFLFYPWGVFVTAYARVNLFTAILACGEDYVYSDTDSVKILNREKHQEYFDNYNRTIAEKLRKAMEFHKLPFEDTQPVTIKGKVKPLGAWDYEGTYKRFKFLRAKAYAVETDKGFNITVSGLNKEVAVPYLVEKYGDKVFDAFDYDLTVPAEYTGRLCHTYIEGETAGYVTDYLGNRSRYYERSSVHLEPVPYEMDDTSHYVDYVMGLKERKN